MMKYIPEPFRIKSVEPLKILTRKEREERLKKADYNVFALKSEDVYIDLLTDSGTNAMSSAQWAGVMMGDESYAGASSYLHLIENAKEIFGFEYIQPVHQGRAAEKVLLPILLKGKKYSISNMHFDTTRAHVALTGAIPVDCVVPEALDTTLRADFKGNMDVERLEKLIKEYSSIKEIVRESFKYADVFTMSAKKDAIVNMGGLVGARDKKLFEKIKQNCISFEGFVTYGGMSGRDLEALAIGLKEGIDENYLRYRIGQMEYLAARLDDAGIAYQSPVGGHGVFVDAKKLLPHIPWYEYPGQALALELYLEAGIRGCDIGSYMLDRDPVTGKEQEAEFEFTRLAIPRRVYTQAHLDVIADALTAVAERRRNHICPQSE